MQCLIILGLGINIPVRVVDYLPDLGAECLLGLEAVHLRAREVDFQPAQEVGCLRAQEVGCLRAQAVGYLRVRAVGYLPALVAAFLRGPVAAFQQGLEAECALDLHLNHIVAIYLLGLYLLNILKKEVCSILLTLLDLICDKLVVMPNKVIESDH